LANSNIISLRRPTIYDLNDRYIGSDLKGLLNAHYDPWIFDFLITQEAPDTTLAEIRVDFTDEFNGETTPIVLYVIGADAQDKAAGTGAQVVTIYGIDADGNPASEAVTMHATAATQIASTTLWKRFIGAQVTQAGAGGVNAGAILITNTGQTATYGTIAAGENATIGTRVYVPANYNAYIGSLRAGMKVVPHATDEEVFGQGIVVEPMYLKSSVTRLSNDYYWVNNIGNGLVELGMYRDLVIGANTYYISMKHATKTDDANQVGMYNLRIIMYGTTNALRGLPA